MFQLTNSTSFAGLGLLSVAFSSQVVYQCPTYQPSSFFHEGGKIWVTVGDGHCCKHKFMVGDSYLQGRKHGTPVSNR